MKTRFNRNLQRFALHPALPQLSNELTKSAAFKKPSTALAESIESTNATIEIPIEQGSTEITNRTMFEKLARIDDVPGAMGIMEVKFLITGINTLSPQLFFLNTNNIQYHYHFAKQALGSTLSISKFNQQTYFTDNRKFLAGTLLGHDSYTSPTGEEGLYALEFWPTDPVKVKFVHLAYHAIWEAMPFAKELVKYHPSGETHRSLYNKEKQEFAHLNIPVITTKELFGNISYNPLNLGVGFGRLRFVEAASSFTPSVRDIVIFKQLPNDLSHVAGVLTEEPQTPLSHINLKAKQNNTPNAYLAGASNDTRIRPLLEHNIHIKVNSKDIEIRKASQEEVNEHLESSRPTIPQVPVRNLSNVSIVKLDTIRNSDTDSYGAKAANLGELNSILNTPNMVPNGFAVPFYFYHQFMLANGFYDEITSIINESEFQSSPEEREKKLKQFRKKIKEAEVPEVLRTALSNMHANYPVSQPLRCRSSTNNEDLEGFNGAGLYNSYTHREDEGHIEKSMKQVWASLWNYRAFEEREFYRIDHMNTAMAVLVHPNFDNELVNGVGLTKNIFDPNTEGNYINAQVGEALVTNPEGEVPDEVLILRTVISTNPKVEGDEIIYIRHSSLVEAGEHVLNDDQIKSLVRQMDIIDTHFAIVYNRTEDKSFAMDIEFKIDKDNQLVIKQARPWVD